jgi:hypothetical protein
MTTEHTTRDDVRFWKPGDIWQPEQWKAMGFTEVPTSDGSFWEIGLLFLTREYAEQVFAAISDWQDEHYPPAPGAPQDLDRKNAIHLSFIIEPNGDYSTYAYPTLGYDCSKLIDRMGTPVPAELALKETLTIVLCKEFPGGPGSHFQRFANSYKGDPYLFGVFYYNNDNPQPCQKTNPIWKTSVKIKKREELGEQDLEFIHRKHIKTLEP